MGFISYMFLLVLNANFFVKVSLIFSLSLFIFLLFIILYKYRIFSRYNSELLIFKKEFNTIIELKKFYNNLLIQKKNVIGLSVIFFSGFREFIYLHRKGISDVIIITKIVRYVMHISMLKELRYLNEHLFLLILFKQFIIYTGIINSILSLIIFFHHSNIDLYKQLSLSIIITGCSEILLPLLLSLFLCLFVDIIYNNYIKFLGKLSKDYNIFIDEFIILLYHKMYS